MTRALSVVCVILMGANTSAWCQEATNPAAKQAPQTGGQAPQAGGQAPQAGEQKDDPPSSVRPGINDGFVAPELDVEAWVSRFEIESREVYGARQQVLKACQIRKGFTIADIGAGTGFYSRLFAEEVGKNGWVYSVDISPKFLQHINQSASADNVANITSVLCSDRSVNLPPNSIDLAFICDTYHHFEHPQSTLASLYRSLKPGGTLVVIDFERIPGKSRDFILGHVRAGKDVFQGEIVKAGFRFVEELTLPEFKENYFLRFRKPQ